MQDPPTQQTDRARKLHEALKNSSQITGLPEDYDRFSKGMQDPSKRQKFHSLLISNPNIQGIPEDFEKFSSIFGSTPSPTQSNRPTFLIQEGRDPEIINSDKGQVLGAPTGIDSSKVSPIPEPKQEQIEIPELDRSSLSASERGLIDRIGEDGFMKFFELQDQRNDLSGQLEQLRKNAIANQDQPRGAGRAGMARNLRLDGETQKAMGEIRDQIAMLDEQIEEFKPGEWYTPGGLGSRALNYLATSANVAGDITASNLDLLSLAAKKLDDAFGTDWQTGDIDEQWGSKLASFIRETIEEIAPTDPTLQNELITTLWGGVSSLATFYGMGALSGTARRIIATTTAGVGGATVASQVVREGIEKGAQRVATGTATTTAAATGSSQMYREAKEFGASEEDAQEAAIWGIVPGVIQVLPVLRILRRMSGSQGGLTHTAVQRLIEAAKTGGQESLVEGIGQIGYNIIPNAYGNNKKVFDNFLEAAALGGAVGTLGDFLLTSIGRRAMSGPISYNGTPNKDQILEEIKLREKLIEGLKKSDDGREIAEQLNQQLAEVLNNMDSESPDMQAFKQAGEQAPVGQLAPEIKFSWDSNAPLLDQVSQLQTERANFEAMESDADVEAMIEAIDTQVQEIYKQLPKLREQAESTEDSFTQQWLDENPAYEKYSAIQSEDGISIINTETGKPIDRRSKAYDDVASHAIVSMHEGAEALNEGEFYNESLMDPMQDFYEAVKSEGQNPIQVIDAINMYQKQSPFTDGDSPELQDIIRSQFDRGMTMNSKELKALDPGLYEDVQADPYLKFRFTSDGTTAEQIELNVKHNRDVEISDQDILESFVQYLQEIRGYTDKPFLDDGLNDLALRFEQLTGIPYKQGLVDQITQVAEARQLQMREQALAEMEALYVDSEGGVNFDQMIDDIRNRNMSDEMAIFFEGVDPTQATQQQYNESKQQTPESSPVPADQQVPTSPQAQATGESEQGTGPTAKSGQPISEAESAEATAEQSPQQTDSEVTPKFGQNNKIVTPERFEQIQKELNDHIKGRLTSGLDPKTLKLSVEAGIFYIEGGARKFADFANKMISVFGEKITPHLGRIYDRARDDSRIKYTPFGAEMDSKEVVQKELSKLKRATDTALDIQFNPEDGALPIEQAAKNFNEALEAGDVEAYRAAAAQLAHSAIENGARSYQEFFGTLSRFRDKEIVKDRRDRKAIRQTSRAGVALREGWKIALSDPIVEARLQQNITDEGSFAEIIPEKFLKFRRAVQDEFIFIKKRQEEAEERYKDPEFFKEENEYRNVYQIISRMPGTIRDQFDLHLDTGRSYSTISIITSEITKRGLPIADWGKYNELITEAAEADRAGRTSKASKLREEAREILEQDPLQMYMIAKHAPEYNALFRERNEEAIESATNALDKLIKEKDSLTKLVDLTVREKNRLSEVNKEIKELKNRIEFLNNSSGVTDAQATEWLQQIESDGLTEDVNEVATLIWDFSRLTLDKAVDYQLISKTDRDNMLSRYEFYVPFNRVITDSYGNLLDPSITGTGGGDAATGISGREGSQRDIQHILSNVDANFTSTIIAGYKNDVKNAMAEWLREEAARGNRDGIGYVIHANEVNPNDNFMTFTDIVEVPVVDSEGNVSSIPKKRNMAIVFSDPEVFRAMQQLDGVSQGQMISALEAVGRVFRPFTNYLRLVRTTLSFSFSAFANPVRDYQTIATNSIGMLGPENAKTMMMDYFYSDTKNDPEIKKTKKEFFAIQKEIWRVETTGKASNQVGRDYIEQRGLGGTTGFYNIKDHNQILRELNDHLKRVKRINLDNSNKINPQAAIQYFQDSMSFVDKFATTMENASRLVAYRAAKRSGMTPKDAAVYSLDANTNFNRNGEFGVFFKVWYQFSGAAIQGYVAKLRTFKQAPKVMGAVVGAFVLKGFFESMWNDFIDEDRYEKDKRTKRWKYHTNTVIYSPFTENGEFTLPSAFGWSIYDALGKDLYDYAAGYMDEKEFLASTGNSILNAFNPFRGASAFDDVDSFIHAMTPTFAEIIVEPVFLNKSFSGPIYPEYLLTQKDRLNLENWQVASPYVNPYAEYISRLMAHYNLPHPSPHLTEYLFGYLGGSMGTDLAGIPNIISTDQARKDGIVIGHTGEGDEIRIRPNQIPIIKRMFDVIDRDRMAYSNIWNVITESPTDIQFNGPEMGEILKSVQSDYNVLVKNGAFEPARLEQLENAVNTYIGNTISDYHKQQAIQLFSEKQWDGKENRAKRQDHYSRLEGRWKRGVNVPRMKDGQIRPYSTTRNPLPERYRDQIENQFEPPPLKKE